MPSSSFLDVGMVASVPDVLPLDEFRASRVYREWGRPRGVMDALRTNLERFATGTGVIAVHRKERDGLFDPEMKARFALLIPHLQRAVAIGKVIDFHEARQAALAQTLDGLDAAVLLVGADGRLVHVNAKASEMLSASDSLIAPRGQLAATDPVAKKELREALAAAARGDAAIGALGIAIKLASDARTSKVVHVLPLTAGQRSGAFPSRATAALFVRETTMHTPSPLQMMAKRYALTAGEVRVLAMVTEAGSVAEIASLLGIAATTVKTHLRRLFAKTGARRRSDLIKLLISGNEPRRI